MLGLTGSDEREQPTEKPPSPSLRRHLRDITVIAGITGIGYVVLRYLKSRENGRPLLQAIGESGDEDEPTTGEPIQIDVPEPNTASDESASESNAQAADQDEDADELVDDADEDEDRESPGE